MKRLSTMLFSLLLSTTASAVCMTQANGTLYKCERFYEGDSYCIENHGRSYKAYRTDNTCSKKLAKKLMDNAPEHKLVAKVNSLLDEIQASLTQIDRFGLSDNDILFGTVKTLTVSSFNDKAVKDIIAKLKSARLKLHSASLVEFEVDSSAGRTLVQMAMKYVQLVARVHQLYVNMAHKNLNGYGSYSFDGLKGLSLKIHKKFGLEILAKVNLKAKHLSKNELEIVTSEDEKQNFEYMSIHKPDSKTEYAKLVQFLAIREAVTNRWAIQRLSTTSLNDPAVNQCGGNFLSYRPKADGSNGGSSKRMGRSEAYQELLSYDKFWNDYVPTIEDLESITLKHSLISEDEASKLMDKIIKGIPTIEYTLINDFGWAEYEIQDWTWETAVTISENEKTEWENYARTILSVSIFPGDDLSTTKIVNRILDDSFMIRYESVMAQLTAVLEILPQEDLNLLAKITKEHLDALRPKWQAKMEGELKNIITKIHQTKTIAQKNYNEKIKEGVDAAKYGLPGAYVLSEINKGVKLKKYDPKKLYQYTKLDSNLVDPATPQELISYFSMKLGTIFEGKRIAYSMDNSSEFSEAAQEFFSLLSEKYAKKVKGDWDRATKSKYLYSLAVETSRELAKKHPFDPSNINRRPYDYQLEEKKKTTSNSNILPGFQQYNYQSYNNAFAAESTGVAPVIYPLVNGSNGLTYTNPSGTTYNTNTYSNLDNYNYPNKNKMLSNGGGGKASGYELMNMMRLSPVVADNTRVAIDHRIKEYNEILAKVEEYDPYRPELMFNDKGDFYFHLFKVLTTNKKKSSNGKKANPSFLESINDQKIMSEHFLGEVYNSIPLFKILVKRADEQKSQTICRGYGACSTTYWWVDTEEPALMRLVQNKKFEQKEMCSNGKYVKISQKKVVTMAPAISFPTHNTMKFDENKIKCAVDEVINLARTAIGSKHQKFNKTQMQLFCDADFNDYKGDDDYKTLFKSVTAIRDSITNDQSLNPQDAEKLKAWDEELQKDTRYWHEAVNEDFIEPMLWVAAAIFIFGTIIVSWLGSAGTLAPATVALFIMIIDVADIAITGASLYFKGMTNFYELPAQAKFQQSLAMSQIDSSTFTTFEDVEITNQKISSGKMMMGFEALFAPIIGAQFSQSAKRFAGITGKRAMSKFGMPVRHFGQPPKSVMVKRSLKDLREKFGIVGALTRKTSDMVQNAKLWLPRFQPYTADELQNSVRIGLVKKATEAGIDSKPWVLVDEVDRMIKRIDDRLVKSTEFTDEFGQAMGKYRMEGRLTFREVLSKPFYTKELFIPKSLIRALKKGNLKNYITNFGETMENLNKLRANFLRGKSDKLKVIKSKLEEAKTLAQKNPGYLKQKGFSSYFDYFQSTLSKEEIKVFRDIAKHEKNIVSKVTGNYQGKAHVFTEVFKDHDKIMETIEPFTSLVTGQTLRASKYYKNPVTEIVKDTFDDADLTDAFKTEDDLIEFYESMLRHDAVENVEDNVNILLRSDIETDIY